MGWYILHYFESGWGPLESSCKHGNKPSDSIKCSEILEHLRKLAASQEELSSVELVSFVHSRKDF
jgi:hypothetical protein